MKKATDSDSATRTPELVQRLVDICESDTVYADVYLRRARELLCGVLPIADYRALTRIESEIATALTESKAATMQQDWKRVETLAGQVEHLRQSAQDKAALGALGAKVYDRVATGVDPFSPGFESLPGHDHDLAALRDALVEQLKALAAADSARASFYEARRAFFAGFGLLSKRAASPKASTAPTDTSQLQQLAAQAAQQGDMAQLRRYAQELLAQQAKEGTAGVAKSAAPAATLNRETYGCPVDLAVPFAADVVQRARACGLASVRTEPLPEAAPLVDYVLARIWQANLLAAESEHEGAMRTAAVVDEAGFPKETAEPIKALIGQLLRNPFVNSAGARYLPQFKAEAVLVEEFPEGQEAPGSDALLSMLGLPKRRGLARWVIDEALQEHGAKIIGEQLGLDPLEFRLVCIPHDLYMRVGRDRGWGQQQQWTHFDGYQVLKNGTLRALVGGDVRYGGLADLVSIALTDHRDSVIARFAVVRRARQVARWR